MARQYVYKEVMTDSYGSVYRVYKTVGVRGQGYAAWEYVRKDDTLVDLEFGYIYKCTEPGRVYLGNNRGKSDRAAFERQADRYPVKKPRAGTNMTLTRSANKLTAKWKLPSGWNDTKSEYRATYAEARLKFGWKWYWPKINLTATSLEWSYPRGNYYPLKNEKVSAAKCYILGKNDVAGYGAEAGATYVFKTPRAPSIDPFSFNTSTGVVSTKVKTNAGADNYERYDTRYKCYVYNEAGKQVAKVADTSSTATEISLSWNAAGYQNLSYNQYYRIRVEAWARGIAGDSAHSSREYYVSYPGRATVTKLNVSSKMDDGKCTLVLNTNSTKEHPVDRVELEYLADCAYEKATDIPGAEEWTKSGIIDDGNCTALATSVQDLIPSAGKYTWVRVKSWHANQNILYRYSTPLRVKALETPAPTAEDEFIKIVKASAVDSTSVLVQLGWNKNGQDDSTGTELSWASEADTWRSTEEPNTHLFTWSDGQYVDGGTTYRDSAAITIKGLDEGLPVYIRARRYLTNTETDEVTYSAYSNTYMYIPAAEADNVVAKADQYVPAGKSLMVSWSFGSYAYQTAWRIVRSDGRIIANGEGVRSAYEIPASRLASSAVNNTFSFTVQVSTGSGFISSESHTVTIVEPPEVSITAETATAQPWSFGVQSNTDAKLRVVVTSHGVGGVRDLNIGHQPSGDTVYSGLVSPEWLVENETSSAVVELPTCDFRDKGEYTVAVTAIDSQTGLETTAEADFDVAWEHQAPEPTAELTPLDEVGEDFQHSQQVTIELGEPDGAAETDLYDIYRLAGGHAVMIGEGLLPGTKWVDKYAPFGKAPLAYRIAVRTADGDVSYSDFDYELGGSAIRFDWAEGTLELPYNMAASDSYEKDVETRQHLDGSVNAYWNSSVMRTASLGSTIINLAQDAERMLARQLARYAGGVFVRTPSGAAFEGNVQVTSIGSVRDVLETIEVEAVEVNATGAFALEEAAEETEEG